MKMPKPLVKQLEGLSSEIEQRRQKAEKDTAACYQLLIWILDQHDQALKVAMKVDPSLQEAYDRIIQRQEEISSEKV